MTYRDRREARVERLQEWSEKNEAKAEAAIGQARQMGDNIPFGQPILVGHHSERRDRNYRDRIARTYERGFEAADKAESQSSRADGIEAQLAASIYDDDPDAIEALEARIAGLEAERDRIKRFNASCRKGSPDESILTEHERSGLASVRAHAAYSLGKHGELPGYKLSNLSGNIKRNRDRLEHLRRTQKARENPPEPLAQADGIVVRRSSRGWRGHVEIQFDDRPDRAVLNDLKAHGFRWDKGLGCWHGSDEDYARSLIPEEG